MNLAKARFVGLAFSRSLSNRPSRIALLTAALTITATLATALVAVSLGIESRLGESLRAFGANLVVAPAQQQVGAGGLALGTVGQGFDLNRTGALLSAIPGVQSVEPRAQTSLAIGGSDVTVIGMSAEEMSAARWRLTGALPVRGQALVGADLASRLRLSAGSAVPGLPGVSVSGVIETGAEEDRALVVPLSDALALTGGRVTEFLVRADTARLEQVASAIEAADPSAQARTVRQVAEAERSLLDKVRQLLLIVTICVALVSAIAVANTLSIIVLERVEEIGLLKAMGATHGLVVAYFALEEGAVALVGGLLGLLAGIAVAETISASVFGATIPVPALAWPVPFAVAVAIALLAGALPVWRAAGIDAASTLKGL